MSEHVESLLAELVEATLLQVEAINALVESNRELIAAMAEADADDDDDHAPAMYLDGRRV